MPRAYLRLDPEFYERKMLAQHYPAGAIAAYIGCLCLAETQPKRGRFRDRKVLGVLLGPAARWIPFLVESGDLVEQDDLPRIYVDGWDEWQEGDWKVAERITRLRNRTHRVTAHVTVEVTPSDTPPRLAEAVGGAVGKGGGGGGSPSNGAPKPGLKPDDGADEKLVADLRRYASSKDELVAKHARDRLIAMGMDA